jgi:hypothetical protein
VNVAQQLLREPSRRSGIQDDARAGGSPKPDRCLDRGQRYFELEQNDSSIRDERARACDVLRREAVIGAGRGHDLLLAIRIHHDERDPGRGCRVYRHLMNAHAFGFQLLEDDSAPFVRADTTDERHARAEACGGHSLIRTFSAWSFLELLTVNGRPGLGQ